MRIPVVLIAVLALAESGSAATYAMGPPRGCAVAADLPFDPGALAIEGASGEVPADLAGPRFETAGPFLLALEIELPPPAPIGTDLHVGDAAIDAGSGAVTINGVSLAPPPLDCRPEE